ncbi:MAG: response regulator [Planctomycetes bacterium]|nr:response regulator [Planctomycetota bacterium]
MDINNILVVDDSKAMRSMVAKCARLCYRHAEVFEAGDGIEALEIYQDNHIDLLLCDVNMPNMDGVEVVQSIRDDEKNEHVYIIMVTTEVSGDSIKKCVLAGADDYLTKPFTEDQLRAKIERIQSSTNRHSRLR